MGRIEQPRLLTKTDDRTNFDCGEPTLNTWLDRHAWRNERSDSSRTYVAMDTQASRIAGFYALATGNIERAYLPKPAQRNRPDPVPILVLGQLAVDLRYRGIGLGASLYKSALNVALDVSNAVGFVGILTHPISTEAAGFYERRGFAFLPNDPSAAMILLVKDLRLTDRDIPR